MHGQDGMLPPPAGRRRLVKFKNESDDLVEGVFDDSLGAGRN